MTLEEVLHIIFLSAVGNEDCLCWGALLGPEPVMEEAARRLQAGVQSFFHQKVELALC